MIKTDYSEVNNLFLSYPKDFDTDYQTLVPFYRQLIGLIPDNIKQFIIVNSHEAGEEINILFPEKRIEIIQIEGFKEIWLRDILGFNAGMNRIYKPIYKPDYCDYLYPKKYLDLINDQVFDIFSKSTNSEVIEMPLVLDCGNLVHNGSIGFITNKIINDNPEVKAYIKKIISDYLGLQAIFIGTNKHDKLSHADGYLNFLTESKICLSNYPSMPFLAQDIKYLNTLSDIVSAEHLEIVNFYDRPVAEKVNGGGKFVNDKSSDCLSSARGIFVNFLILNDTIILPEYTLPSFRREIDFNRVNRHTLESLGYKVIGINCDLLAKLGGSIRCCTFTS